MRESGMINTKSVCDDRMLGF